MDRQYIDQKLCEIQASLPLLLADSDDPRDFWSAFAAEVNHLSLDMEAPEDKDYARERLNRMLQELGLVAEGVPPQPDGATASAAM